jgi:hypothetical protein
MNSSPVPVQPGSDDAYFDIKKFEELLARLEASKAQKQNQN